MTKKLAPAETQRTIADCSNVEIVMLAVYLIGGHIKTVDTEDVAIKAHEIAPGRFSWRKYPQQIDIERVRVRLSQAAHENTLSGVHSKGWRLTAAGTRVVQQSLVAIAKGSDIKVSVGKADRSWISGERRRLMSTEAYRKYSAGQSQSITRVDVAEFFRIDEYSSRDVRERKLDRFLSAFRRDKTLGPLVEELATRLGGQS